MKRLLCLLCSSLLIIAAHAAYTVQDIPNVHLSSSTRYVSNPDGILSPATETRLDSILADIWRQSSAEAVVVAINDIDPDMDPDEFATELFGEWGIGKKDKDNGLLLLIVKDRRKAVIRTGYGMEGVMPDIIAGKIIRHDMAPHFRNGDYDSGTIQAVAHMAQIIEDPEARNELMSKYENDANAGGSDMSDNLFHFYVFLSCAATGTLMVVFLLSLARCRKYDRYHRYVAMRSMSTFTLIMTFLCLGMPLVVLIPLRLLMHHWRRGKRLCPNCRHYMQLVDEEHDNDYLTPSQDTEEKINSVDYDVWLCPQCRMTEILPYVNTASGYVECPNCHGMTATLISDRVTMQPTVTHAGIGTKTYECRNCHNKYHQQYTLPKLPPVIITSGGGRGFGGGGGGFSGGSFGGGMTGGGGASGGW